MRLAAEFALVQVAVYDGSIFGCESIFVLDIVRSFSKGVQVPVDAVTAAMLACSRYGQAFQVSPKGPHQGKFTAWSGGVASVAGSWTGPAALAGGQAEEEGEQRKTTVGSNPPSVDHTPPPSSAAWNLYHDLPDPTTA
eukprot:SM003221S12530  [mRNA]  locus=s3221:91:1328:- [translate_table: standard]